MSGRALRSSVVAERVAESGGQWTPSPPLPSTAETTERVFECLTEFQGHDVVQDGIDDSADVIHDTGHVEEDDLS